MNNVTAVEMAQAIQYVARDARHLDGRETAATSIIVPWVRSKLCA